MGEGMMYIALLGSACLSILGLYAFAPIFFAPDSLIIRLYFGIISVAYLFILVGSLLAARHAAGNRIRYSVAISCLFIPSAWLIGCFDRGMISGIESRSVLLFVLVAIFQWFIFESFRIRTEA